MFCSWLRGLKCRSSCVWVNYSAAVNANSDKKSFTSSKFQLQTDFHTVLKSAGIVSLPPFTRVLFSSFHVFFLSLPLMISFLAAVRPLALVWAMDGEVCDTLTCDVHCCGVAAHVLPLSCGAVRPPRSPCVTSLPSGCGMVDPSFSVNTHWQWLTGTHTEAPRTPQLMFKTPLHDY